MKSWLRAWRGTRSRMRFLDQRWGDETVAWLKRMRELPEAPEIDRLRELQRTRPMPGTGRAHDGR